MKLFDIFRKKDVVKVNWINFSSDNNTIRTTTEEHLSNLRDDRIVYKIRKGELKYHNRYVASIERNGKVIFDLTQHKHESKF
jgi:hypothetical protein